MKQLENMTKTILYSVFAAGLLLVPARSFAQAAPAPAPTTPPAQTPAAETPAPVFAPIGEDYRVELQVGAWLSYPFTAFYSDTESTSVTANGTTTTTVVTGTNVDFHNFLGLKNQVFPEGHLTIRLAPKHKLRGEYTPVFYKQTQQAIAADFNFNGQTYKKGDTVESTLHWNEWYVAYEFDPLVSDRGYVGALVGVSSLGISGATANAVQNGTASVNIVMPGLGATARYYVSEKLSASGDFLIFDLPGSGTDTHGHIIQASGYVTYNLNKHVGAQLGFRFADTSHTWSNPLNTGSQKMAGPFLGGTLHF